MAHQGHSHGGDHGGSGHSHEDSGHSHAGHGGNDLSAPLLGGGSCCGGHGDDGHDHGHDGHNGHDEHGHGHQEHGHGHEEHGHGHEEHGHGHDEHCHGHGHGHDCDGHNNEDFSTAEDQRRLKVAVGFALFFLVVEIVGGVVSNSLAIITDAAHMMSDVSGFVVSLVGLQLSVVNATEQYTYGFKQAEVLGALLSIAIVWALTAILVWEAIPRFQQPEEIDAPIMFTISVIGFVVNIILMGVLGHGHSHGGDDHGHGHSHGGHDDEAGVAVQAALAHVIGDIVQSLGVCLASVLIWVGPSHMDIGEVCTGDYCVSKWNYADPLCTVLFSILVLITTKSTFVRTIETLMGKTPSKVDQNEIASQLACIPDVASVHDFHVWPMGSKDVLCSAHIVVFPSAKPTAVLNAAVKVARRAGVGHTTFQIEIEGEFHCEEQHGDCFKNEWTSPKNEAARRTSRASFEHGHGHEEHGHSHANEEHGHAHKEHGHAHDEGHSHV